MEKAELFEHNEKAYKKLIEALKHSKCTTINHATGTGKSFIVLKYLYKNKHKKFLYIAPTYPILEQIINDCYKIGLTPDDINIDTMIYRTLLKLNMDELYEKYDGFIFDEYHRVGAKETYKKIKQLKLNLQESNDSKVFIGLTATPVRYLDRERNMTQEIFDGNVASSISLAEAMLEELLPVPLYINSKIACRNKLEMVAKKVDKLAPTKEKSELEDKIKKIDKEINNGTIDNTQMIKKYVKDKDGKYIIFCNTINSLERIYRDIDKWFADFGTIKKYKVYSGQQDIGSKVGKRTSKEINQSNIDRFNEEKNGISVLLCVDILNEGVHVDNIDGVVLLRKTKSPIIYFQQIGRALSFSGRHKQIKIFDLVNNFGNHNAIDMVYLEFNNEMKKLMQLYPEKAEQYQNVLNRFKIMDETRQIIKQLEEVEKETSREKIITSKINYSINLLKEKLEDNRTMSFLFTDERAKQAYTTIARNYKYVDNEQFKKLLELDIILPEELSMSYEERIERLNGYNSIKEKEEVDYDTYIERFIEFVNQNGKKPDYSSENGEERLVIKRYMDNISDFEEEQKKKIIECLDNNKLKYEPWEKVLLDKPINVQDIELLIKMSNEYLLNNQTIPEYIQSAVTLITLNYNIRQNKQLFLILEQSEKMEEETRKQKEQARIEMLSEIMDVLEANVTLNEEELEKTGIVDRINKLKLADRSYISRRYSRIKKIQYSRMIIGAEKNDLKIFCKKMKTIKEDEFDNYFSSINEDKEMYATLKGIVEFMAKNRGKLPSKESKDELERKLSTQLEKYVESGRVLSNLFSLEKDMQSKWYSPEQIMYSIIYEDFKESDIKLAILKNIQFYNKHGHRALKNSQDEEEKAIATEYEKKCIANMSQDKLEILNKIFNGKKSIKKACEAYISNLQKNKIKQGDGR